MVVLLQCAAKKKNAEAVEAAAAFERDKRQRCASVKQQQTDPSYQPKGRKPPPIVLTAQRFSRLYADATGTDLTRAAIEREEEEKYRQYLKDGSDELVKHFGTNIKRTQEQKLEDLRLAFEEKKKHAEKANQGLKDISAAQRLEKLTKAHQILEKLQPGPRELHSAVMESEILQARNMQIAVNQQFQKAIKQQECLDRKKCDLQATDYVAEDIKRNAENIDRKNAYKIELKQTIDERQELHLEKRRHELKEEKRARELIDREVQLEIEKEREMMKRKKEQARKNALEAMKIAEQRRIRERMVNEIESRVACVFNTGKDQLKRMAAEHERQRNEEKEKQHDATTKLIISMQKEDPRYKEEQNLLKVASEMRLKFTAEEEKKKRKYQAAKLARIQEHLQDVQRQKLNEMMAAEQRRYDMAERYKNTEVNNIYNRQMKQKEAQRYKGVRDALSKQIKDKQQHEMALRAADIRNCQDNLQNVREDRHFFEYASDLMNDARKKGRPLQPFIRAVNQYKKENHILVPEKLPRHLVSNVPINNNNNNPKNAVSRVCVGRPPSGDCNKAIYGRGGPCIPKMEYESRFMQLEPREMKCMEDLDKDKGEILQHCLKIDKLIAEEAAQKKKPGISYCPIECMQHRQGGKGGAGKRLNGLNNDIGYNDDCASMTSSARLRYSVWQLKQLNHYDPDGVNATNDVLKQGVSQCLQPIQAA